MSHLPARIASGFRSGMTASTPTSATVNIRSSEERENSTGLVHPLIRLTGHEDERTRFMLPARSPQPNPDPFGEQRQRILEQQIVRFRSTHLVVELPGGRFPRVQCRVGKR